MKKFEGPVTDENFSQAWKHIDNKLIEMKKKNIIRMILRFVTNISFLFCLTTFTYGILRFVEKQMHFDFLGSFPILSDVWNILTFTILSFKTELAQALPTLAILVFVVPLLISLIIALLVLAVYHPKHISETQDKEVDSKTLWEMSQELQLKKEVEKGIFSPLFGLLYMIIVIYILLFMGLKFLATNNLLVAIPLLRLISPSAVLEILNIDITPYIPFLILGIVLIYALYLLLNGLLNLLIMPLYKTKIKTDLTPETENYYYEKNPSVKEIKDAEDEIIRNSFTITQKEFRKELLTEEEVEISKKATEILEKRLAEKTEFKNRVLYVHPVAKYSKLASYALVLILLIVFVNKIRNFDLDMIYDTIEVPSIVETLPLNEVAPIIESLTEEDLLAVCSYIPDKEYKEIIKGLSKVSALDISEDASREEFADKIGNMSNKKINKVLNNLTDEDLFNIVDSLPKEMINEYIKAFGMSGISSEEAGTEDISE